MSYTWFFTICTHAHRLHVKGDLVPPCLHLYHIYIAPLINCIQPDDGHSSNGRNIYFISYIHLIIL